MYMYMELIRTKSSATAKKTVRQHTQEGKDNATIGDVDECKQRWTVGVIARVRPC